MREFKDLSNEEKYKWYKKNKFKLFDLMIDSIGSTEEEILIEINKLLKDDGLTIGKNGE